MKTYLKSLGFTGIYGIILYVIYQQKNTDLLLLFLSISLIIPIVYLLNDRNRQQQHIAFLHQESLTAELNLLKSQINPHFFFNTLNNLYGMALEKSEHTPEVIYKLSQMMRFTIYEGRKNSVSVVDEIAYLENFIELNRIRYNDTIDIQFLKNIEDEKQRIPPLLFINLLENAFKHGVDSQTENQFIHFQLHTSHKQIKFTICNNFDEGVLIQKKRKRGVGGLGEKNLSRRLDLLFADKHQYTVTKKDSTYESNVIIDLT